MDSDEKEIKQLNTDKARLMHEVQRLMQTIEHLENTMNDSEEGHLSEVSYDSLTPSVKGEQIQLR